MSGTNREEPLQTVQHGRVRLVSNPEQYRESFDLRFRGDPLNGWLETKAHLCGREGLVTTIYGDRTVTMQFSLDTGDHETFDFPFEAIAEQLSVQARPEPSKPWRVLNVDPTDENEFRAKFHRFNDRGDTLNEWNAAKQAKIGCMGLVMEVYEDNTVTMLFEDFAELDFPFEALEEEPPVERVTGMKFVVSAEEDDPAR